MNDKHTIPLNHGQRRYLDSQRKREKKHKKHNDNRIELTDHIVYTDDSYKDKRKVFNGKGLKYAKERILQKNKKYDLPEKVNTERKELLTDCLIINKDGKERAFMPDKPGRHCILVHGDVAKALVSGVCMLARVTTNLDKDGKTIDGSWAIVPAEYRMMNATTIQTLRKRPLWFLRRYYYEISFDGRVQPAHLFFDYGLNPSQRKQRLWITREFVPIRGTDKFNDFFRFWLHKPKH